MSRLRITANKLVTAAYGHALACWRRRDLTGCIAALTPVAAADPPSALLLQRAKTFLAHPPVPDWDAVKTFDWVPAFAGTSGQFARRPTASPQSLRAGVWSPAARIGR